MLPPEYTPEEISQHISEEFHKALPGLAETVRELKETERDPNKIYEAHLPAHHEDKPSLVLLGKLYLINQARAVKEDK